MNLKYFTVSELLLDVLKKLMADKTFDDFVLVGVMYYESNSYTFKNSLGSYLS
jgi:hypothetical protein